MPMPCPLDTRRTYPGGGQESAGSASGGPPHLSGIVPDVRSASWLVRVRVLDLRQADLSKQGRPLAAMLTIVRRPLNQLGDGSQRVIPEPGLGVDERQTLPTRLGHERSQPFG